jgi:hypothetical protein
LEWEKGNVEKLVRSGWLLIVWLGLACSMADAQEAGIARKYHPWGQFQPGAWKLVRVLSDTFDSRGSFKSITETKTTLAAVDPKSLTLQVEADLEVSGKPFGARPQTVRQGFDGDLVQSGTTTRALEPTTLTIQGQEYACQVQEIVSKDDASRTVTKIYYTDQVGPLVLKREAVRTDLEGKTILGRTLVEVTDLGTHSQILNEYHTVCHMKAVYKGPKGTTTTVAVVSADVPGGVICQTLKETDSEGRLISRSSLELLDYGVNADDHHAGLRRPLLRLRKHRLPGPPY